MSFFKKLIRTLVALALVFTLTLSLASCMGRTVVGAYLNSENELIIKYSDGTTTVELPITITLTK